MALFPFLSPVSRRAAEDVWRVQIYVSQRGQLLWASSNNSCLTLKLPQTSTLWSPLRVVGGWASNLACPQIKWRGKLLQDLRIGEFFFFTSTRAHAIALKCSTLLRVFMLLPINVQFLFLLRAPLTSSIFVAQIREAPHVAQTNDGTSNREKKLHLVAPLAPFLYLMLQVGRQVLGLFGSIGEAFCSVSFRTGKEWRYTCTNRFPALSQWNRANAQAPAATVSLERSIEPKLLFQYQCHQFHNVMQVLPVIVESLSSWC